MFTALDTVIVAVPRGGELAGIHSQGEYKSSKTQVATLLQASAHRLMVIAANADFLETALVAGKTDHVLVMPRMGV